MSKKITELTSVTELSADDLLPIVVNNSSVPETKKVTVSNLIPFLGANGRLTLASGNPVPTADQTAKTTLYYTPYNGNYIALYDGSGWVSKQFSETSISLSGFSADTNYDVFGYYAAGFSLELEAWTNATTRATALVFQDGIYVKDGETNKRYLGTIRTTATVGQCEDSLTKRFVWNYYNRSLRVSTVGAGSSTTHTYASTTTRPYNNDNTFRVEYVKGVLEESSLLGLTIDGSANATLAYGYDQTTVQNGNVFNFSTSRLRLYNRFFNANESIGFHTYYVLESSSSGTATFNSMNLYLELMG